MIINPEGFSWKAPTQNEDGSPIVGTLNYTLYIGSTPFVSFPGALQTDGRYSVQTDDLSLPQGQHRLSLTAFYLEDEDGLESAPSNTIDVVILSSPPKAPAEFSAVSGIV